METKMIGYCNFNFGIFKEFHNDNFIHANWHEYFYEKQNMFRECLDVFRSTGTNAQRMFKYARMDDLENLVHHLSDIGEKMQLFYYDDTACIIGYGKKQFVMDSRFVAPELFRDYSNLTSAQMKSLTGSVAENGFLPAEAESATVSSLETKKAETEANIEAVQAEIKAREDEIRQEMYKKIEAMKTELNLKVSDLNSKLEQFQKEIFVLESQIYTIRCYTGEAIKFHQIRTGAKATSEEPLVLFQKIRYLDEEMGKHLSMFDVGGEDDDRLLSILKNRDDVAALLAPGSKSLSVLKVSRTGKFIAPSETKQNILEEYDQYHGTQLALLLRDGENLYIAWCDEDKIQINEENVFYSLSSTVDTVDEDTKEYSISTNINVALSRYYILAIIQGLIDSNTILSFPEPVNMAQMDSKYIVYSFADGWITTNKYGTFKEQLDLSKDIAPKKGDQIITVLGLRPERTQGNDTYINDRGIGSKNRTRDTYISGQQIYTINNILYDLVYEYEYEAIKVTEELGIKKSNWIVDGVPTIKEEPTVIYTPTNEILFTGKSKTEIGFEYARELKESQILDFIISQVDAQGSRYHTNLYYKDSNGRLCKFTRWSDRTFFGFDNREPELSNKELFELKITGIKLIEKIPHAFVSVEKKGWGSYSNNFKETKYNVNFELMDDEYLNTTFLCSPWLNEVITNSNIGPIRFPGVTPSFADMLPYLHKIMDTVKARECVEKELIHRAGGIDILTMDTGEPWQVRLCEWKIKNEIHELTPTRAKKFIKEMDKLVSKMQLDELPIEIKELD